MVRAVTILTKICLLGTLASAQIPRLQVSMSYISTGKYHPDRVTPFSFLEQPAALASWTGFSGGFYMEKRFMTEGLNFLAAAAMISREKYAMGLQLRYFGSNVYNERVAALNYGRSLGRVTIGTSIASNIYTAGNTENSLIIDAAISTRWSLSADCFALLQARHLALNNKNGAVAPHYKLGLGARLSPKLNLGIEFSKEELRPPQFIIDIFYQPEEKLSFRAGLISGSAEIFFGLGWKISEIRAEMLAKHHSVLGISPALLFTTQPAKQ